MFFIDLMIVFGIAVILSLLLAGPFAWRRPGQGVFWGNVFFLFLVFFFISWAGGVWLPPFGPVLWGAYWMPFVLTAVIVGLLLLALVPPRRPRTRREAIIQQAKEETAARTTLDFFLWILVLGLLIAIIVRYVK